MFCIETLDFYYKYVIITALQYGDVPKWLKGADSKSARRRKACGGSNPSISANKEIQPLGWVFLLRDVKERDLNHFKCNSPGDCCSRGLDRAKPQFCHKQNANQIPPTPQIKNPTFWLDFFIKRYERKGFEPF